MQALPASDEQSLIVALRQENERLSEQVKRLVKTEHGLYQFQEKLDNQIRIYHQLYEIGKQFNISFDVGEILAIATRFVLYQLNFERCIALLYAPGLGAYRVQTLDGYYDDVEREEIVALHITPDDPALERLIAGEQVNFTAGCDDSALFTLAAQLRLDEYVAFPLGAEVQPPVGLLIAGNTQAQAPYQTRVAAESEFVVGMANLVSQVTTTLRMSREIAAREQRLKEEARGRERFEHELRVARLVQQSLLVKTVPPLSNWRIARHYQPAREIGGDFYDFLMLPDRRLGLVVGDVTDKGVPAALLMASTRSIIRAVAQRLPSPGQVLAEVNELLCPDVPANMFVTCFYAILDPSSGLLRYANAGHNLPIHRLGQQVGELRALGMPLGLMEGMNYPEEETVLVPGADVLFYSDGLVEAHNPERAMFSARRAKQLIAEQPLAGAALIEYLLAQLAEFTGPGVDQEDDITLVTLQCVEGHPETPQ